jgi:hypothetical protein
MCYLVVLFSLLVIGCEDSVTTESEVYIIVTYCQPDETSSIGITKYDSEAIITWESAFPKDGGTIKVPNSTNPTRIYVPLGAILTANYGVVFRTTSIGSRNSSWGVRKTLVAYAIINWEI